MSVNPSKLEDYALLITGPMQDCFGTGFAIYADNDYTYVVTAYHVVRDVFGRDVSGEDTDGLFVGYTVPAKLFVFDYDKNGFDLAVLRVAGQYSWPAIQPKSKKCGQPAVGKKVRMAGFHSHVNARKVSTLQGTLASRGGLVSKKLASKTDAWDFHLDKGCKLEPGYSGSPLVDMAGDVIGVVISQSDSGNTGTEVVIDALLLIWQEMPAGLKELFPERTARKCWLPITVLTVFIALLLLCGFIRTKSALSSGSGSLPIGSWPLPTLTIQIAAAAPTPSPVVTPLPQCPDIQIDPCLELDLASGRGQKKCPLPGNNNVITLSQSDIRNLKNLVGKALVANGDGCTCQWVGRQTRADSDSKAIALSSLNDCSFSIDLEKGVTGLLLQLEAGGPPEWFKIEIKQ